MRKIFINGTPVILSAQTHHLLPQQRKDILQLTYKNANELSDIINYIEKNGNSLSEVYITHENMRQLDSDFNANYQQVTAAGGVVFNAAGQLLLMCRREKWDLPKGKVELNEQLTDAALREIAEETGISDAEITGELLIEINHKNTTYHTYLDNNRRNRILKTTYWYKMFCQACENLQPQTEEGITALKWVLPDELNGNYLNNTYGSIRDVLSAAIGEVL
ncbi:MAG: NUDIX domain-containing protein [Sphingobacteriales bacterium]|nr:MAG: NUDIX domain-containing protein [Sphingobacteriales bacterium]